MDTVYVLLGWNDVCQNGDDVPDIYGAYSSEELAQEAGDELVENKTVKYYSVRSVVIDEVFDMVN